MREFQPHRPSGGGRGSRGIAPVVIVVVIIIVVVVAGVASYYVISGSGGSPSSSATSSTTRRSVSSVASSLSTGGGAVQTYTGTFSYSLPLGPTGVRVGADGTVERYNSTQVASGTFAFAIDTANYTGTGTGQGTLTVTTTGFCSGKTTLSYTFDVSANDVLQGNVTVAFETPTPANYTASLTCTGSMSGVASEPNSHSFLSVYPNLYSTAVVPVNDSENPGAGIAYQISISAPH